jgi:hypothetical protein
LFTYPDKAGILNLMFSSGRQRKDFRSCPAFIGLRGKKELANACLTSVNAILDATLLMSRDYDRMGNYRLERNRFSNFILKFLLFVSKGFSQSRFTMMNAQ